MGTAMYTEMDMGMNSPMMEDSGPPTIATSGDEVPVVPKALLPISEEKRKALVTWLDQWIRDLTAGQQDKLTEWAEFELAYRALPDPQDDKPYRGACKDTIPVIAMAVEPVHARLETGIFKSDPFVVAKPIRKTAKKYSQALEHWFQFYFTKVVPLQKIASPGLLEQCKLGTMVMKVPYEQEHCRAKFYDNAGKVVERNFLKFRGPRPKMVSVKDFLFPAHYQHLQDCPCVFERQRTTIQALRALEYDKWLTNVDEVERFTGAVQSNEVEDARAQSANHDTNQSTMQGADEIVVYECWFRYDLDLPADTPQGKSKYPLALVATFHPDSQTLLQLRYNPYYHQRFPYVVTPYTIANGTLYGVGIGEMALTFQRSITALHRNAVDNTYLANCRGFIRKRNSVNAESPIEVYAGFTIWCDDINEVKPFNLADVYSSTIQERQNLFGMVEKRTGVSDYMTGRESPALGSRATATSTLALIQEGTRRVEQVIGNERAGFAEVFELCMWCWAQFGLGELDDYLFEGEETGALLNEFFKSVIKPENVGTMFTIDISPSDATTSRQVQQQMQLGLIQMMTSYMQQLLQVGQLAVQAQSQGLPQVRDMVEAIVRSAQVMYRDLLDKFDLPNADQYLPDILQFISALPSGSAGTTGIPGQLPGVNPMAAPPGGAPPPVGPGMGGAAQSQPAVGTGPVLPGFG